MDEKVKVLVVDDQYVARGFFEIRVQMSKKYELVSAIANAEAAIAYCAENQVDLVIMDVMMKYGLDGLTCAKTIKNNNPEIKIIMTTSAAESRWIEKARAAGIESFWFKEYSDIPLTEVMDRTMKGESVYPGDLPNPSFGDTVKVDLSERELEVLRELTRNRTNDEIAEILHISTFTVKRHIQNMLVKTGYKNRIDLAVKHPDHPGCYAIAIECDGASYHAAKTARERDRIRPDVLQGMGWKTYRVWSPDWVKDPQAEGARLIEAVEEAIKNFKLDTAPQVTPAAKAEKTEEPPEEMVVVTAAEEGDAANPYHFDPAPEVAVPSTMSPKGPFGRQTCLKYLITTYFPVHVDVLTKAIYADTPKITPAMKAELQADMVQIEKNDMYRRKGDFFYPPVIKEMPVRLKGGRMITHIAQDEIEAALLKVAQMRVGINQTALIAEAVHGFGFKQKTPKLTEVFTAAFDDLLARGKVSKDAEGVVSVH